MPQSYIFLSIFFIGLTVICSSIGDDDVVYNFLDRKPTPHEAIIRIRWVAVKALTSIYVGLVLTFQIGKILKSYHFIDVSSNAVASLALVCIAASSLIIGVLQNQIRRLNGRPTRPLVDRAVWQRSLGPWGGRK